MDGHADFRHKKIVTALVHCKQGNGFTKVNEWAAPRGDRAAKLRNKLLEPILLLGKEQFVGMNTKFA